MALLHQVLPSCLLATPSKVSCAEHDCEGRFRLCPSHDLHFRGQLSMLHPPTLTAYTGRHHTCMCCCRYTAGKRKGSSHASPAKRMALSQEVPVTCGSSSGVYDIRRGCVSLRAAQHGQVCLPLCLFLSCCVGVCCCCREASVCTSSLSVYICSVGIALKHHTPFCYANSWCFMFGESAWIHLLPSQ